MRAYTKKACTDIGVAIDASGNPDGTSKTIHCARAVIPLRSPIGSGSSPPIQEPKNFSVAHATTLTLAAPPTFDLGDTLVTYTAVDAAGNVQRVFAYLLTERVGRTIVPGEGVRDRAWTVRAMRELLEGLSAMHALGLAHHDVSLENVMLTSAAPGAGFT
mgnify:CR=1 FL=1